MRIKLFAYFLTVIGILSLLSACSSKLEESANSNKDEDIHTYHAENGDLRELTNSNEVLPDFLNEKPEQMQIIYGAAAQHKNLLEAIPCYCGCSESGDHKDNYDCFVYENKQSGGVVWDDHGTRCGVCLDTAAESIIQYKDGKSIKEIRQYIDNKYKEGYAEPTPTPFPS
ncbi:PCYCGC motif-containing (lipo)protein [Bacillus sp. DTU_2020_1000418_1_SI_GHA_SEK_038]|uniref:PCYCGC motif-containing (lipo)protein n=1 Tax=Bacillus sp. DTU_2020_1000418_1_SI_GHA_SEK_038 TaxID=3077585 RepID=UPI0028E7D6D7|nr:PCYCGC motif-containing (lipo)protein [Bacillus sp. DTU_2020_1000418_1_SI_GHA_SEK_038]WNS73905.1 PCYCGC motif-containing (lipo)protein [Bacillus sp. DTU_2020_1000418_1_SI_GHA_SEK_038]